MKTTFWILIFSLMASAASGDSEIDDLAGLMDGKFDTQASAVELEPDARFVDQRRRVAAPQFGDYVFYQQINHREDLAVYRQRLLVLEVSATGRIEQRAYAFKEPEWYVDAGAEAFGSIALDDVEAFMPDGCEQVWTRTEEGFRGYVDPKRCEITSSRTGKQRQIESENVLTESSISLVERGYDPETGEQLFGSPQGESILLGRVE